ncbi:MAG: cob(I)yrinic acid a,c-diamide adenosyltransferase [Chloroflexota bacterium]
MAKTNSLGLVQVYTGNGKGKTTAALGLALRASGQGFRVGIVQFLKGNCLCGEHRFLDKYPGFAILQPANRSPFGQPLARLRADAQEALLLAAEMVVSSDYDLLVLDEVLTALQGGLLESEQVLSLLAGKPDELELVLTGRGAPPEVIAVADLVTEMVSVKHPFDRGVAARRGVEY